MMRRLKLLFIGIILLTSTMYPPSLSVAEEENIVTYALPYDFDEYSQFTAQSYASEQWLSSVRAGLYSRSAAKDRSYDIELAESMPQISSDGLVYTVKLKSGLKFSDGSDLTSDDVIFTYEALLNQDINFNSYPYYATYLDYSSIVAIGDLTIEFTFEEPNAFALSLMEAAIQPRAHFKARLDAEDYDWNAPDLSDSISAGPFMVDSFDNTNMVITVVKNPNYWNADYVVSDKIVFMKIGEKAAAITAMAQDDIQILDAQYAIGIDELDGIVGIMEELSPRLMHQEVSFNHISPYWGTGDSLNVTDKVEGAKAVRKAISHVINRDYAVDDTLEGLGVPMATMVPPGSVGWDSTFDYRQFDIVKAIEYMEAAGFDFTDLEKDEDGYYTSFHFNITILSPNTTPARILWAEQLLQDLPLIGIGVTQHLTTDWATIIPRTVGSSTPPSLFDEGGFDLFIIGYGWQLDFDPAGLYESTSLLPVGSNFYNFENDEYDALITTYTQEHDFDKRIDAFKKVQEFYYEWEIVAPIVTNLNHWAYSDDLLGYDSILLSEHCAEWDQIGYDKFTYTPQSTSTSETTSDSETTSVIDKPAPTSTPEVPILDLDFNILYFMMGIFVIIIPKRIAKKKSI